MSDPNASPAGQASNPPAAGQSAEAQAAAAAAAKAATPSDDGLTIEAQSAAPAVVFEPTGDAALDVALEFIGRVGIGPDDAAMKAAETGDFTALKIKLASLGDKAKGWEKMVALGEQSFKSASEAAKARATKDQQAVEAHVGGKEQWDSIRAWTKANAEPAELEQVNAVLRLGGFAAKVMAEGLQRRMQGAPGTVVEGASVAKPGAKGAGASQPLTAQAYANEVAALRSKLGSQFDTSPQYKALQERRSAARKAGY